MNDKKSFNKFLKLTIYSTIGSILFFMISSFFSESGILQGIILFPTQAWGVWFLGSIVFNFFFFGGLTFLFLTPIFGIIASIQTHKNKEKGGPTSLILTAISILFIITLIYAFS